MAEEDLLGTVVHYYDKIGVAVIKLTKGVKVGDKVKFVHKDVSFEQGIESMQLDHVQISVAEKDQEVAIKVDKKVNSGTLVYLA